MTMARLTSVRLDESKIDALSALAALHNTSIAEEIRTAVTHYIMEQDGTKLEEALNRKHQEERAKLAEVLAASVG
ncbi:MAG: hypothetical protein LBE83_06310 [Propionibacteriaceae bacterium]|jgi:hypothetical protein|nr:hypothetical protein [Propionibacteriaceae bacterium]